MSISDRARNGVGQVRSGAGTAVELAVTGGVLAAFVAALPVRRVIDQRKEAKAAAKLRESTQFSEAEVAELRKLLAQKRDA
jgi:hypothetical protein